MAVKAREYMLSVDNLSRPKVLTDQEAIAHLLIRILLLNPGSNPLHPDMGVGLKDYRFCIGRVQELEERIKNQIRTYMTEFAFSEVKVVEITEQKICNIEITVGDTVYIYDSTAMPVTITLDDYTM